MYLRYKIYTYIRFGVVSLESRARNLVFFVINLNLAKMESIGFACKISVNIFHAVYYIK